MKEPGRERLRARCATVQYIRSSGGEWDASDRFLSRWADN
jgi:hypothetical protein